MTALFAHLEVIGMVVVNCLITIGLLIALAKTALGRHDGYRHLIAVCVAAGLLLLFTTGQLAAAAVQLMTAPVPAPGQTLSQPGASR